MRQWTMDGELAAYSCGGSLGFGDDASPNSLLAPALEGRRTLIDRYDKGAATAVKRGRQGTGK
jgi:hypothetical protein